MSASCTCPPQAKHRACQHVPPPHAKAAWDHNLVDKGMQLLLMWEVYGYCHLHTPAWPAYARLTLALFSYLGWQPVSLTHKPGEQLSARWGGRAVISFGDCQLHWAQGCLVAVQVKMTRTKFNRDPLFDVTSDGKLINRQIGVGKLTYSEQVDTCPVLAWLVWALLNGAFGSAPFQRVLGGGVMGSDQRLQGPSDMTCEDVDRLVGSVFAIQPWVVPAAKRDVPLMTGQLLYGSPFSAFTVSMSTPASSVWA